MKPARPLAALLLAAVILTGCLSNAPAASRPRATLPPALAPLATNQTHTNTTTRELAVSYDDTVPMSVSLCPDLNTTPLPCEHHPENDFWSVKAFPAANYTHAKLTLTWTATTPGSDSLAVAVMNQTKDPDGTVHWHYLGVFAKGPSPLVLDGAIRPHDPKNTLLLLVEKSNLAPPPSYIAATTDQPFHAEGRLTITEEAP